MPRPKGSKNKTKTVKATVDFAAQIAEKQSAKEAAAAEIESITANIDALKTDLKTKKTELKSIDKEITRIEAQKENDNMILTNNEIPKIEENNNVNNISKIKYATAIKLSQDAVADIKKAGYNVSLEEIDTTNDYQIIIKLQK